MLGYSDAHLAHPRSARGMDTKVRATWNPFDPTVLVGYSDTYCHYGNEENMKIARLGAGGGYFTRPISDFALCEDLHGCEISLYDIDRDRGAWWLTPRCSETASSPCR